MGRPRKNMEQETKPEDTKQEQEKVMDKEPKTSIVIAFDEDAEKVATYSGNCINCENNNKIVELQSNGVCKKCGFDKSQLHGAF